MLSSRVKKGGGNQGQDWSQGSQLPVCRPFVTLGNGWWCPKLRKGQWKWREDTQFAGYIINLIEEISEREELKIKIHIPGLCNQRGKWYSLIPKGKNKFHRLMTNLFWDVSSENCVY
jgi:hypothetical protein